MTGNTKMNAIGPQLMTNAINITLNGERRRTQMGSIAALVADIGLDLQKVAVERNMAIVPRSTLSETMLADGDVLEIVHFVGGG
jgi:thiamine biosynthesis protein ThiS